MSYNKYQSQEWVNVQQEMYEDENSASIMDEFNEEKKSVSAKLDIGLILLAINKCLILL